MKNLSIATIIEKNRLHSNRAWLIALKIHIRNPLTGAVEEVVRVINNTEITMVKGEPYEPFPFDISITEKSNELPSLSITIQDQTYIVQSYMNRYGGAVGSDVDVMIVHASSDEDVITEPELTEYFQITKSGVADYVVSWTLGAENPLTQFFPARRQDNETCSFRFKDNNCGYTGTVGTCDLTLSGPNGCRAKNNGKNYGGFPGIITRG